MTNALQHNSDKAGKILLNFRKRLFFWIKLFFTRAILIDTWRTNLTALPRTFWKMAEFFCAAYKTVENFMCLWKNFLKKLFWTRRMQNSGARIKSSEKTRKFSCWKSEKDEEIRVLRKNYFFQNVPLDTLVGVLTTPTKTCRREAKNFSSMSETEQENYITNEFIPQQIVLLGYVECSFHNLVEIILTGNEIFLPNVQIYRKKLTFFQKLFQSKLFLWSSKLKIWQDHLQFLFT